MLSEYIGINALCMFSEYIHDACIYSTSKTHAACDAIIGEFAMLMLWSYKSGKTTFGS